MYVPWDWRFRTRINNNQYVMETLQEFVESLGEESINNDNVAKERYIQFVFSKLENDDDTNITNDTRERVQRDAREISDSILDKLFPGGFKMEYLVGGRKRRTRKYKKKTKSVKKRKTKSKTGSKKRVQKKKRKTKRTNKIKLKHNK